LTDRIFCEIQDDQFGEIPRGSRRAVDKASGALASSPPAEQLFAEHEAPLALERAAVQLPEPMAELYRLRTAGLSYEEIAETLDIPLGSVKSRMKAMLGRLREEMDKCTAN
jgi:DNA-directed RNA polymerase specialized sigma24 family protein